MEGKPMHYDGSVQHAEASNDSTTEPFLLTDEMRNVISSNPYSMENNQ
ncbi:hypothetical protein [Bacillus sp. SA1-12]|nr:hypothetical protein [Bacillus sp. SA1-12]